VPLYSSQATPSLFMRLSLPTASRSNGVHTRREPSSELKLLYVMLDVPVMDDNLECGSPLPPYKTPLLRLIRLQKKTGMG